LVALSAPVFPMHSWQAVKPSRWPVAKALMIQGTGSGAGKSVIVAALCRIFRDQGLSVAPFKAQNMALNSFITAEGGEIGRAQALQAQAARIEPTVHMNPVLLKASGQMCSQVIIQGVARATMQAREYYGYKKEAWKAVKSSYRRLSDTHDLIILEGAGSPAEINLVENDIVNMAAARHAKAPVVLVGDIDRGGVFASLYGTVKLTGRDAKRIKAFIINKFRGDVDILRPGLKMIQDKTGRPVIGVLPYVTDMNLPEEDGLALTHKHAAKGAGDIRVVVVRLPFISNFTDFDPLSQEPDVELVYSFNPVDVENAHIVIVPGTKNTVQDLLYMRRTGLEQSIKRAYSKGIQIIGVCGGYQMLGTKISDLLGVESGHKEIAGMGLLNIETSFAALKTTCQVRGSLIKESWRIGAYGTYFTESELLLQAEQTLTGYEIHMGSSTGDINLFLLQRLARGACATVLDGSRNGNCWGTYIHGLFDNDAFRRGVLNHARRQYNLPALESQVNYALIHDQAIDNLTRMLRENVDMNFLLRMAGL